MKEALKEADIQRIKVQRRISNLEPSLKVQKQSIRKINDLDDFVRLIKTRDVLDLCYLKEVIEKEQRELIEVTKKHPPLTKFLVYNDPNAKRRSNYAMNKNESDFAQDIYRNYIRSDPSVDFDGYIRELRQLKIQTRLPKRAHRNKIWIIIEELHKTNADYKRSQRIIGNPRNPFEELSDLNYDLESDDSENDDQVDKLDEDDDNASNNEDNSPKGMSYREKLRREHEKHFRKPKTAVDIHIWDWDQPSDLDQYLKTRVLYKLEKIELPNKYELPRISDTVSQNLKEICKMLHGSYASKVDLIDSICIKLNLKVEDLEPTIWKLCTRERCQGDEVTRFYVHDKILRYLKIDHDEAILICNEQYHNAQSKATKQRRITLSKETPFKGSKSDILYANLTEKQNLINHFKPKEERKAHIKMHSFATQDNKFITSPSRSMFDNFRSQASFDTNQAVKGSSWEESKNEISLQEIPEESKHKLISPQRKRVSKSQTDENMESELWQGTDPAAYTDTVSYD